MRTTVRVFLMGLILTTVVFGKIGYVNMEAILSMYPELEETQQEIAEQKADFENELNNELMRLQEEGATLSQKVDGVTEEEKVDFQKKQEKLAKKKQNYELMLQKLQEESLKQAREIYSKINTAIEEVSKINNVDVVIEQSVLLYVNEETVVDMTSDIEDFLGGVEKIPMD